MTPRLDLSLIRSFASEHVAEALSAVAEAGLAKALESGALDGVPVLGLLTGGIKAAASVRDTLYARKVLTFLHALDATTPAMRRAFLDGIGDERAQARFGETVLLLLDRADDMVKPRLIARVFTAHINGHMDYRFAVRLARMVDRCYGEDFEVLINFRDGVQDNQMQAESLFAVGLLSHGGFDGGDAFGERSGVIYRLNEFGANLRDHALGDLAL